MNLITRESMSKLVIQPSFRAVGQTRMGCLTAILYVCLLFSGFSNVYHFMCVWPTALKLGCVTNFDMLFLVMGFISLAGEI